MYTRLLLIVLLVYSTIVLVVVLLSSVHVAIKPIVVNLLDEILQRRVLSERDRCLVGRRDYLIDKKRCSFLMSSLTVHYRGAW